MGDGLWLDALKKCTGLVPDVPDIVAAADHDVLR
jgi:hypothetical protein